MSTVDEYHKYARDCLRWAAKARTEEQRQRFLSLAHDWTQAVLGLEGVRVPSRAEQGRLKPSYPRLIRGIMHLTYRA
jgi:hypothetical protein